MMAVMVAALIAMVLSAATGVAAAASGSPLPVPPVPAPPPGLLGPPGPIPVLPLPGQPRPPNQDPFYRAPHDLAGHRPGDILRSRPIVELSLTSLTGIRAYQLLYRSTDARGAPIATVATVLVPNVPAPGPRRLVSYHTAEDSLTTRCAPSYNLRTGSGAIGPESGAMALLLARGWDVVVPDYEGPHSEFTVGPLAGQAALDGVRAAERFDAAGLPGKATKVGMMGYSGGSIPTVWANAMAHHYAPELNLVGIAAGGVPANLRENLAFLDGSPFFSAIVTASIGIDRAYPDLDLDSVLNNRGRELAAALGRDAYGCSGGLSSTPQGRLSQYTHYRNSAELLRVPRISRIMDRLNLIKGPKFSAPADIYQAVHDEIVTAKPVDELVSAQCRAGAIIDYHRLPVGEHAVGALVYLGPGMQYLADRFAGKRPSDSCV
jgi:hypothetical protein